MTSKTFIRLLAVLVVLAGAAYWLKQKPETRVRVAGLAAGDTVFADLDVNNINAIELSDSAGTVKLRRGDKVWVVEDLHDYPALFTPLAGFLRKLNDLKVSQVIREGEATGAELGLEDGSDTLRIKLTYASGKPDVAVTLGGLKQPRADASMGMAFPTARFMRVGEGPALLVDDTFSELWLGPVEWVDRELTQVSANDVTEVTVQTADESYMLTRAEDGTYSLNGLTEGESVDAEAALKLFQGLQGLRFDSVFDPQEAYDTGTVDKVSFKTMDGLTYELEAGREEVDGGLWLRLHFVDSSEDGRRAEDVAEMNERHGAWRYKMPLLSVRNLLPARETLVKKSASTGEPSETEENTATGG